MPTMTDPGQRRVRLVSGEPCSRLARGLDPIAITTTMLETFTTAMLGKQLHELRRQRQQDDPSFTLASLCKMIDLSPCQLLALERGELTTIAPSAQRRLAEALGVDARWLLAAWPRPPTAAGARLEEPPEDFGAAIKRRREQLHQADKRYSLRQVAERVGLSPAHLSSIENEKRGGPAEDAICALADDLGQHPDQLLALAGKLPSDVEAIILRRPQLFARLIREIGHLGDEEIRTGLSLIAQMGQGARALAHETLEILNQGYYHTVRGARVEIAEALQKAIQGTITLTPATLFDVARRGTRRTRIQVRQASTLAVMRELVDAGERPLVLNFADALHPGGPFRKGGRGQEQTLVGASGLLKCIEDQPFYEYHRAHLDPFYSDHLVYAPDVPVFRDAAKQLLEQPYSCSFISASAVNARALEARGGARDEAITAAMRRRIEQVLGCAHTYGHACLVLGAWGCGVFGNDPRRIAALFHEALTETFAGVFDTVVFAIEDNAPDAPTIGPFRLRFERMDAVPADVDRSPPPLPRATMTPWPIDSIAVRYEPTLKTLVTEVAEAHGLTAQILGSGPSVPKTDIAVEFQFLDQPVRLQLLFSSADAAVRVNLRARTRAFGMSPSTESGAAFQRYIKATFARYYDGVEFVRVPDSPLCYFKPFAPRANGRQDVAFPLDGTRVLIQPDWLEGPPRRANLREALSLLFPFIFAQERYMVSGSM